MSRAEDLCNQFVGVAQERSDEPAVRVGVRRERPGGRGHRLAQDDRRLAVERVGDRRGWLYPCQSVLHEREPGQIRRENAERVSRGADVVVKPRQRELRGAGPASDRLRAFHDQHVGAVACQFHSGSQAVGAAADNHSVQARRHVDLYAAGVAATTSPLARTIPSSQTASTRPPWNCCS